MVQGLFAKGRKRLYATTGILAGSLCLAAQTSSDTEDKYRWLEDVWGQRSLAWVKAENERSAKVIEQDPHYAGLEASALEVLESKDRLPTPDFHAGEIYNAWQDADHVRGILRRTSLTDYLFAQPHWQTVLDYDALGKQDKQSWVGRGLDCLYPGNEVCLVGLSAGGEDAVTLREFDLRTSKFVTGGFVLSHSKQTTAWIDNDTLLVARDWGHGTLTKSGYPYVLKLWKRGEPLEKGREIFRGHETDMSVDPAVLDDGNGNHVAILIRTVTFFEKEMSILTPSGSKHIQLPLKADINGLVNGQIIVTLNQDWKPEGQSLAFQQGSIVALDLAEVKADPGHLKPALIFAPTAREFAQSVSITKNRLLLTTLENVQARAYVYVRTDGGAWTHSKLPVADARTVFIETTNQTDNQFFLSLTGFLTPSSLWRGDAETKSLEQAKTLPAQFDSAGDIVEQLEAISKDGTRVPYFVVRPKNMRYDGSNPALLTAYGGFQYPITPTYSAMLGKLWLERGGVYVLANIRGGGEFGPAWHEAGLKTHRQRIYDDFAAVGQDLVTRHITSPRRLGIEGGSNGGLLMGVEMTQHPEMWNAVVIQVPLLDMLRYEQIAAGSSWVGEYGSVSVPEERAFLASISPYNELKRNVNYPEPFIFTTTKDDRVGPVHARKFAAKMNEYGKPFLYEEITEGGHGTGADLKQEAKSVAFEFTYLTRKLMD